MSEPPSPFWTLGAVALGGLLSLLGTIVAELYKSKKESSREKKSLLRTNLYDLQDQLMEAFEIARAMVHDLNDPLKPTAAFFLDRTGLKNAIVRTTNYTVRIGDDPLSQHVEVTLKCLSRVGDSNVDAMKMIFDSHDSYKSAQLRIGELLHTNAEVDLGLDHDKRRWKPGWLAH